MENFEREGFAIIPDVLPLVLLSELQGAFAAPLTGGAGGIRNVLSAYPVVRRAASSDAVRALLSAAMGGEPVAVRGILFDKTTEPGGANWKVPYHQDRSIAVRERPAGVIPGFDVWSVKEGVPHVQPPRDLLERLVTVRLHLDPCEADRGALRVLPGTHRLGILTADEIAGCRAATPETVCAVPEGGALVFRPLLLHASSPVTRPNARRRVLHLGFAPADMILPPGITWFEEIHCR